VISSSTLHMLRCMYAPDGPISRSELRPLPTDEEKPLHPTSIYAINKRDHKEMALAFGHAYTLPAVARRFFNIYGSRPALSNPSALATFATALPTSPASES
jgi:nucleoside-diphosphate-sugar epimerase